MVNAEVNVLRTCAIRLVLLVDPISAIRMMCDMGFASTWLISQVGGRILPSNLLKFWHGS